MSGSSDLARIGEGGTNTADGKAPEHHAEMSSHGEKGGTFTLRWQARNMEMPWCWQAAGPTVIGPFWAEYQVTLRGLALERWRNGHCIVGRRGPHTHDVRHDLSL